MEDPEALAQRGAEHAGPGRGPDQGEGPERDAHGPGIEPLVHHEVDREVLHRRVEQLLHGAGQAMDLVDEQHVPLADIGEDAHEVGAALERGPAVIAMDAPISLAMMAASVVLPSPGGPESKT